MIARTHQVVVMIDGVSIYHQLKDQWDCVPIIWISNQGLYKSIAQSLFVEDFWVKPIPIMLLKKQVHYFFTVSNKSED